MVLKTESGLYNNGIKNCYIPKKEIPLFPNPNKFPLYLLLCYDSLEKLLE